MEHATPGVRIVFHRNGSVQLGRTAEAGSRDFLGSTGAKRSAESRNRKPKLKARAVFVGVLATQTGPIELKRKQPTRIKLAYFYFIARHCSVLICILCLCFSENES